MTGQPTAFIQDLMDIETNDISAEDVKELEKCIGIGQKTYKFTNKNTVAGLPKASQVLLEFCTNILKIYRVRKTNEYKKKVKEVEAKLREITKAKVAKEDALSKLNAEIKNLSFAFSEELPYYKVKFY